MERDAVSAQLLLYEADKSAIAVIGRACRQLGVRLTVVSSDADLEQLAAAGHASWLFVSSALYSKRLHELPLQLVLLLEPEGAAPAAGAFGLPVVLDKPVRQHEVAYLLKSIFFPESTELQYYPSQLVRLSLGIRSYMVWAQSLLCEERFAESFAQAAQHYCSKTCPQAKQASQITAEERKQCRFVSKHMEGGERVCAKTENCTVRRFAAYLETNASLLLKPLKEILETKDAASPVHSPSRLLSAAAQVHEELERVRAAFCLEACGLPKQGIDFRNNDIFLSNWSDLLRNSCVYCAEQECPLAGFLDAFTTRVVQLAPASSV